MAKSHLTRARPGRMNGLLAPFALIWTRRRLLYESVKVAVRQRYAGASLGLAWLGLGPLLLLGLYSAIYLFVFRVRPVGMQVEVYILYIFSGLVPFINFSQGLTQGTTALAVDRQILLNTVYPPEFVPLREVAASVVNLAAGMLVIAAVGLAIGKASLTWLLVPLVLVLMLMFLAGLTWILSLVNLVLKDIQQVLTYVTIMLLIASPIAYTPDMLPSTLKVLIFINPLAYFVISFQSLIVLGTLPPWPIALGATILGIGTMMLGGWVFRRAKTVFFDYA